MTPRYRDEAGNNRKQIAIYTLIIHQIHSKLNQRELRVLTLLMIDNFPRISN